MNFKAVIAPMALIALLSLPVVANADTVNQRLANQHKRIENGIHSGELTYKEQHAVEARDAKIHRYEHSDRKHNKGKLSSAESKHLQHRLNYNSHKIYAKKHNGKIKQY